MKSTAIIEAAGLLIIACGDQDLKPQHFLLMRHRDRWDLPKGHCEAGESLIETAFRETEEETGIVASEIQLAEGFSYSLQYPVTYNSPKSKTFTKRVTYFLGRVAAPCEIRCQEHQGCQWFQWSPPHHIQVQTIDPLLAAAASFLATNANG